MATLVSVSIPLWFSLNTKLLFFSGARIGFPSHYGSRSTLGRRVAALSGSVFPSHYGSRSEEPSFVVRPRSWTRPSYIFSFRRYESGFLVLGPRQRKERRCRIRVRHDGKRLSSHTPYRHPVMLLYGISLLPGTNNEQPTTALIIPLWFSLNLVCAEKIYGYHVKFPSHYGSRSTGR